MSTGNGNGRIGRYQKAVAAKAGLRQGETLPYAPDYFDSLIQRIRTSDDAVEYTFDWLVHRASGNQSLHAIHLYGVKGEPPTETDLRQRDCALEVAWLQAGHREEWLDARLELFREEAARRGVTPIDKTIICAGFTENRRRRTIASDTGHVLELVPSPKVGDSTEIRERKGESPAWQEHCEKWRVAHSAEYAEEVVARSIIERNNKLRLSSYRTAQRLAAPKRKRGPSLEAIEPVEALEEPPAPVPAPLIDKSSPAGGRASSVVVEEPPTEQPPARPPEVIWENVPKAETPEWHTRLRAILKASPRAGRGGALDEPMFQRIAAPLTEALLDQFEYEIKEAKDIRKWAGYEAIAKQVAAGGVAPKVAAASAGGKEETYLERRYREEMERRRAEEGKGNG
jgi:hypothetical protein